jgi:cytochrome c biogenesis protein CcmG, thiol:disulfide interchange protein DsbE
MKKIIPLILFLVIAAFLFLSLNSNPSKLPSPLLGKIFPSIEGNDFYTNESIRSSELFENKMTLVNVWASWCTTCRKEHEMIMNIAKNTDLQLIGVNYKDTKVDGEKYLEVMGNPFDVIIFDPNGKIGMDLGVYATPETFLVNQDGLILYKHIGEIDSRVWEDNFAIHFDKSES